MSLCPHLGFFLFATIMYNDFQRYPDIELHKLHDIRDTYRDIAAQIFIHEFEQF